MPAHVVVMGVSGSGKTSVAEGLVPSLPDRTVFAEGDEFHPPENVEKMSSGHPLTDEDRWPWLERLAAWTREQASSGRRTLLTCSALRRAYRDVLRQADPGTFFLHLHGDREVLLERMQSREHFMAPTMLDSQLDTLEHLEEDERGALVDVGGTLQETIDACLRVLAAAGDSRMREG